MTPDQIREWYALIAGLGFPGAMFMALVGLFRRWWYPASYVDELRQERDEWKSIALTGVETTSKALVIARRP